ncbi:MAG: hypothetical protein ABFS56_35710 [Pseudomonadota bacterium]
MIDLCYLGITEIWMFTVFFKHLPLGALPNFGVKLMLLTINDKPIKRVAVVNDTAAAREEMVKQCLNEFEKQYAPDRKPWRTLVRIEEINRDSEKPMVYAVIPGWEPDKVVRFPLVIFPEEQRKIVIPGARFFAKVNIGATHHDELYFEDFEVIEKPRGKYAKFLRS